MGVAGLQTVRVTDPDPVAIAAPAAGLDDDAVGGGDHRRAVAHREVDALVHALIAGDRVAAHAEVGGDARAVDRGLHHAGTDVAARLVEILGFRRTRRLEAIEADTAHLGIEEVAGLHRHAALGHGALEDDRHRIARPQVAREIQAMREDLAHPGHDRRVGAERQGRLMQGAVDLARGDRGLLADLLGQFAHAQRAVEVAGHRQLGGRAGAKGQADQTGGATSRTRARDGGLEAQAGADVDGVEVAIGERAHHGGGLGHVDAGPGHGLDQGFARTDLYGHQFGRLHAFRGRGVCEGAGFQAGQLRWRQTGRVGGGFHRLVDPPSQDGDSDGGADREQVRRHPHGLASRIELSHRPPTRFAASSSDTGPHMAQNCTVRAYTVRRFPMKDRARQKRIPIRACLCARQGTFGRP